MLKSLITKYFDNIIYIQISSSNLKVVDVISGLEFNQPPFIAMERSNNGKSIVKAVGVEAQTLAGSPAFQVENPFLHPRQLIANFQKAEKVLQHAIRVACGKKLFAPSPRVVLQPIEKLEGGLTEVEIRAFRELCLGAGAREAVIYVGAPLLRQGFDFDAVKRQGV